LLSYGHFKKFRGSRVKEYFVEIGLFENLSHSMTKIAEKLGRIVPESGLPELNRNPKGQRSNDKYRDMFRERYALEYAIYDFAASKMINTSPSINSQTAQANGNH